MPHTRRTFLKTAAATLAAPVVLSPFTNGSALFAAEEKRKPLTGEVGITTSSVARQLAPQSSPGKFTLLELPRMMRDELDMKVIDLNTSSLASTEPDYLDRVREAAEKAGCVLTNLKLNQSGLDMSSPDTAVRDKALAEYRRSIDVAARLGLRWVRPLPLKARPDMKLHVAAYQHLADYAGERGIQVLVENFGWMESDPDSVAALVKAAGKNVAACPDTGNWSDNLVRYQGLVKTFPLAVTCDFKARTLGPNGEHELYDLKRCYTLGRQAGFNGPWCLEHAHADTKTLFRELGILRDLLRKWMAESA